jgi:hypothetical protein
MRDLIGSFLLAVVIVCGPAVILAATPDAAPEPKPEREMVCYDSLGYVTFSDDDWKECRLEVVA